MPITIERAALLATENLDLLRDPVGVTERVYQENDIKVTNLQNVVRAAVWEAQIKLVFPKLENFRVEIIRKYASNCSSICRFAVPTMIR